MFISKNASNAPAHDSASVSQVILMHSTAEKVLKINSADMINTTNAKKADIVFTTPFLRLFLVIKIIYKTGKIRKPTKVTDAAFFMSEAIPRIYGTDDISRTDAARITASISDGMYSAELFFTLSIYNDLLLKKENVNTTQRSRSIPAVRI